MKTIKVYEVGVDDLPVDGVRVILFDKEIVFNMFEDISGQEGCISYLYGDIASNFNDALMSGGYLTTDPDEVFDVGEHPFAIPIQVEGVREMCNGDLWMYSHEYLTVVSDVFPFQTWGEYQLAIKQEWVTEESYVEGGWYDFPKQGELRFDESVVVFNNVRYQLKWTLSKHSVSLFQIEEI